MESTTITIRLPEELKNKLQNLAHATGRSKSFLALEAIQAYVESESWQIQAIEEALYEADQPDAKFAEHEKVATWLKSWGTDCELEPPECG